MITVDSWTTFGKTTGSFAIYDKKTKQIVKVTPQATPIYATEKLANNALNKMIKEYKGRVEMHKNETREEWLISKKDSETKYEFFLGCVVIEINENLL